MVSECHADGNLTETTRPSGVVTTTEFDLVDRATSIVHAGGTPEGYDGDVSPGSGAPGNAFGHCNGAPGHVNQEPTGCWSGELAFGYDYDARGLVVQRTVTTDEGDTVTDYEHDALGRLTESVSGDYTATYGWDAGSNLVNESVSDDVDTNLAGDGWVIDRDVNAVNQVTQVVTDVRLPEVHTLTESLTYDARGNRTGSATTRTTGNKTHEVARVEYTFDGMNQLVGVLDHGDNLNNPKDDVVTGWSRDGLGRGLTVTEAGLSRDRVFDGTALIVDGDTRVTMGPDGRVLSEAFETVEGHGKNAHTITVSRDVLTDLLGSAVGIAQDGIVNADLTWFGDFGDTLSAPGWDTVTSFTGRVETAGLVEFATRTYDPASRVWVQDDSFTGTIARASSLNRYAYVEGSPVSHTDVLGAYRAAAAMAAQQLSAADYAAFMADLKLWAAKPSSKDNIGGFDWGTTLAGGINVLWGGAKFVVGASAMVGSLGLFGTPAAPLAPEAELAATANATLGALKFLKGIKQIAYGGTHPCAVDCGVDGIIRKATWGTIPGLTTVTEGMPAIPEDQPWLRDLPVVAAYAPAADWYNGAPRETVVQFLEGPREPIQVDPNSPLFGVELLYDAAADTPLIPPASYREDYTSWNGLELIDHLGGLP